MASSQSNFSLRGLVSTPRRTNTGSGDQREYMSAMNSFKAHAPTAPSTPKRNDDEQRSFPERQTHNAQPRGFGEQNKASPARVRKHALEAEHEFELLKRQEIHQKLLRASEGRRDRAHTILSLHRGEIVQLEEMIRLCEIETKELETMRKDLAEAVKRQELVVYRTTKEAKLLRQETHASALTEKINNKRAPDSGSNFLNLNAASSASLAGIVGLPLSPTPTSTSANAAAAFEFLTQRLEEARRVGNALEAECLANEEALSNQRRERDAMKDLITVAESHVKELEANAPATLDALKVAQEKMRTATNYAQLIPSLRQMVSDTVLTLQLQKTSSAATIRALMDAIKVDDDKLRKLRQAHGGSGASALQLDLSETAQASPVRGLASDARAASAISSMGDFGAAFASSIIGKIATDLERENATYATALAEIVRRSEEQRVQLQSTADTLSSRVRFLEEKAK